VRVDVLRVVEGLRLLNLDVVEPFDWVLAVLHAFGEGLLLSYISRKLCL
jgi:hypothetical protein